MRISNVLSVPVATSGDLPAGITVGETRWVAAENLHFVWAGAAWIGDGGASGGFTAEDAQDAAAAALYDSHSFNWGYDDANNHISGEVQTQPSGGITVGLSGLYVNSTDDLNLANISALSALINGSHNVTGDSVIAAITGTNALFNGTFSVTGESNIAAVTGTDALFNGAVTITGNSVLASVSGNNLNVSGNNILGAISGNSVNITGNSILAGVSGNNISITGNSVFADISGTSISISGTATITGNSVLAAISGSSINITGSSLFADVSGNNINISGNNVLGAISGNSISITGNSTLAGISGNSVSITGNSILAAVSGSSIHITGNSTLAGVSGSSLNITGNSVLAGISGTGLNISGNVTITGLTSLADVVITKDQWKDIIVPGSLLGAAASAPDPVNLPGTTTIKVFGFDGATTLEQLYGQFEMPHDYKEGSLLSPHVHWCASTAASGSVVWNMDYAWANPSGTFVSGTISGDGATTSTSGVHLISDLTDVTITGLKIGGILAFRLWRDPTVSGDTYEADACLLSVGAHYVMDTLGSDSEFTK
jgi:hypothetical protein